MGLWVRVIWIYLCVTQYVYANVEDSEPYIRPQTQSHYIKPAIPLSFNQIIRQGGRLLCHDREHHVDLFKIFVNGLRGNQPRPNKIINVTIVGAGISGMVAGILLKYAGHNVRILEANDQLGGRISTFRNLKEEWHVEWGPMRFPRNHYFTQFLLHKLRLRLTEFHLSSSKTYYFIGGQTFLKTKYSNVYELPYIKKIYNLTSREMNLKIKDLYSKPLEKPLTDLNTIPWKEFVRKYDKFSFRRYLREVHGYSVGLVHLIGIMSQFEGIMEATLVEVVQDECIFGHTRLDTIVEGTDTLIKRLSHAIINDVTFNANVNAIRHNLERVRVKFNCIGTKCMDMNSYVDSDFVIMTPLPTVVSKFSFTPLLSNSKRYALRHARLSGSVKVVLTFNTPFWEKLGIKGGKSITDLPSKSIVYPSFSFKGGLGVLLVSYTWGYDAQRQEGMSDEDIIAESLYTLSKVHQLSEEQIRARFRKGYVKKWGKDPFTLGAFALFTPNYFMDLFDDYQRSEGRIVFAGDTNESLHGWIDSALKSATRAVKSIMYMCETNKVFIPEDSFLNPRLAKAVESKKKMAMGSSYDKKK